jgi:heterodisulfide reductase subunit C
VGTGKSRGKSIGARHAVPGKEMEKAVEAKSFIDEISAIPGGEKIHLCMQCGTCTASCPSADKMDHTNAELIAMIRAGLRKEVLSSNAMWHCMSCYMCTVRCPRGIKPANLMHILEGLAQKEGLSSRKTLTPAMYRTFNEFVRGRGRVPEVEFMGKYYLRTNPLHAIGAAGAAAGLLSHGRLNLKAGRVSPKGVKQLQDILSKAKEKAT